VPNLLLTGDSSVAFPRGRCRLLSTFDRRIFRWQSRAENSSGLPAAPAARVASLFSDSGPEAPEASAKTREEKGFGRYDKNKDGKVEADEYLAARHKNFDKLDADHNGALSFQEYAAKGIEKFNAAGGRRGWLSPAEFVATAPPPAKRS
jgi:hypothetical protein